MDLPPSRKRFREDDRCRQGTSREAQRHLLRRPADDRVREGRGRRHAQVAVGHGWRQRHRNGLYPGADPRHALRVVPGRLRPELPVLFHGHAGLFPQPVHRRDHRPGMGRGQTPRQRAAPAAPHHQRGDDGHGRAVAELRQRGQGHEPDARRPGFRPGEQARHAVHGRPRADDRQALGRKRRLPRRCRCTRPTTSCVPSWCR